MGKITDIKQQKKNLNRLSVDVDDSFAFGISAQLVFEKNLKISQEISKKEIEDLIFQDQTERLLNKSLRFLSFRPRSEKELRDHLLRKGRLKEVKSDGEKEQYEKSIEMVVNKLKKIKQLDDQEFTRWWVEQRNKFKPSGKNLLRAELLSKGINKETVNDVIESNSEDQIQIALLAARKKMKLYTKLPALEIKTKLNQFLARRGFDWGTIKKVVDSLVNKE
ncbi:MAG: RecX family transcriptional regulator [Candidatus Woykebacteria bacterium]